MLEREWYNLKVHSADPSDHTCDGSGDLIDGTDAVTTRNIRIEDGLNISAHEYVDHAIQVSLGLVSLRDGHRPIVAPPPQYQSLLAGGYESDEDDDEFADEGIVEGGSRSRGQRIEEEKLQTNLGVRTEAEAELALQQAVYRSLQDQSRGPSDSGPTQPSSALQNSGTMETEPLPQNAGIIQTESLPQNAGGMQAESEEQYTGPSISDFQKAKSHLEA
ncbi:uncharacterized protein DFL_001300 [Arthrobotrys flagrans]|uniref:Uncharacterized protein n=1 Tax=Arthrobotrys flagrans TaxID=97331 RepID=A0A437AGY8_ARTFL|nr:hypothetical protein DFL_001300 [Arthrobotrys flagrans]